jgi:hypothetical protein
MSDAVEVTVAELQAAVSRLLEAGERRFGSKLDLGADEYWSLWPSESFDAPEPRLLRGSLVDDVNSVREFLDRDDRSEDEVLLWHEMNHLIGILMRIASLAGA